VEVFSCPCTWDLFGRSFVRPILRWAEFSDTNILAAVDLCGKNYAGTDIRGLNGL
jgi:hypothetical protein